MAPIQCTLESSPMLNRYTVRVLGSDGIYPAAPLVLDDFAVLASDEFAWSAVHGPGFDDSESSRYGYRAGEISWLSPDEILFFAAVSLAEPHPRTNGRLLTFADSWCQTLELRGAVQGMRLVEASREIAASILEAEGGDWLDVVASRRRPETVSRDYTESVRSILEAVDSSDPLVFRGLYKLLMAVELRRYRKFLEESALAAMISREAVLELLRRKLSSERGRRLGRDDVLEHIRMTFSTGEPFVEVLESDWEVRIMIAHPVSEFGEHWSPPVDAEECYDALNTLTYLYRYYLLGEPWTPGECD